MSFAGGVSRRIAITLKRKPRGRHTTVHQQLLYHIVFSTKQRRPLLQNDQFREATWAHVVGGVFELRRGMADPAESPNVADNTVAVGERFSRDSKSLQHGDKQV